MFERVKFKDLENVPIEKFGKDHWSTFAYIETRCVDHRGELDLKHMRCNPEKHPHFVHLTNGFGHIAVWKTSNGTRLSGFCAETNKSNKKTHLKDHDDWDCIDDMEAAGLIIQNGNLQYGLTDLGWQVISELRKWKGAGGSFGTFVVPGRFVSAKKEI